MRRPAKVFVAIAGMVAAGLAVGSGTLFLSLAGQAGQSQAQQQTSGALGAGWWGVAGAGMGLAGVLMVAILIVVLRESRH